MKKLQLCLTTILVMTLAVMFTNVSAVQARTLDKIKKAGVLKVANSGAYPPFSFVDKSGNLVGFDVDIAEAVAKKIGVKAEVMSTPWNGIIAALVAGKFDTCICSMSDTEERRKAVDFTGSYYYSGQSLWVENDSKIQSIKDLKGKKVGTVLGETSNEWAMKNGNWTNMTYQGLPDLLLALTTGRVNAVISDDVPIALAVKKNNYKIRMVEAKELQRYPAAFSLQQGKPELKAALQKALDEIKADGTYQEIVDKWIGLDISK